MSVIKSAPFHLIMALPIESQGLFEKANIPVHFCGIGKINAAALTAELILKHGATEILNLGTAGSNTFPTHSMIECSGYVQRDMDLSPLGFPLGETPMDPIKGPILAEKKKTNLLSGVCGTGDAFEVGQPKLKCDLVDMEAYAIAKVCKKYQVGFTAIKYITDGSDHNAHKDWKENLKISSQKLYDIYLKLLQTNQ